jgi:ribonuclease J
MVEEDQVFDELVSQISQALVLAMDQGAHDTHQLQQVMRRVAGRWISKKLRRRPMIIPVIVLA